MFLGWHLHSGGRWKGDYLVVDLDEFRKHGLKALPGKVCIQRVREVFHDAKAGYTFPMLALHNQITRELTVLKNITLTITDNRTDAAKPGGVSPSSTTGPKAGGNPSPPRDSADKGGNSSSSNAPLSVVEALEGGSDAPRTSTDAPEDRPTETQLDIQHDVKKPDFTVCTTSLRVM